MMMKTSIKAIFAALALSLVFAGPSVAEESEQPIDGAVRSAITGGNVNVSVENGVATLSGWVESQQEKQAALRVAISYESVDSVVDLITVSG